jgi:hypothetical protein
MKKLLEGSFFVVGLLYAFCQIWAFEKLLSVTGAALVTIGCQNRRVLGLARLFGFSFCSFIFHF